MKKFKLRASQGGKLATKPRSKSDLMSKTAQSYLELWLKEELYGMRKEIHSKYLTKGNVMEDVAIDHAIEWLDLPFVLKNEQSFEDDFFTGTPDVVTEDEIIDVKNSWDFTTFPIFEKILPNKDYFYQVQIYMHLTGKRKARVVYLLENTPEDIAPWEQAFDYSHLDKNLRIKSFQIDYDEDVIIFLQEQVIKSREWISQILQTL